MTYQLLCRACLRQKHTVQQLNAFINSDDLKADMQIYEMFIMVLPGTSIEQDDHLPNCICNPCLNKLKIAYNFQQMCLQSDKTLRKAMLDSYLENVEPPGASEEKNQYGKYIYECKETKISNDNVCSEEDLEIGGDSNGISYDVSDVAKKDKIHAKSRKTKQNLRKYETYLYECTVCNVKLKSPDMAKETDQDVCKKCYTKTTLDERAEIDSQITQGMVDNIVINQNVTDCKNSNLRTDENKQAIGNTAVKTETSFSQKSRGSHKTHLRHAKESSYLCSQCGKAFSTSSNLRQHTFRHSKEHRYSCLHCPRQFPCKSDQLKHMITHRETKRYFCEICGSTFSRSDSLNKHKQIHSGEKPFECDECGMSFVRSEHMKRHKRTHTKEKPYKCTYCQRVYTDKGYLVKHLRKHVGENTYFCKKCPAAFKYHIELQTHQSEHQIELLNQIDEEPISRAITDENASLLVSEEINYN